MYCRYPHIRPICLPTDTSDNYAGYVATVTGWGRKKDKGRVSNVLREVIMKVITQDQCKKFWPRKLTSAMLCVNRPEHVKGVCHGDSGGPLVTAKGGSGMIAGENYELIGVVSGSKGGCGNPKYPDVYVR